MRYEINQAEVASELMDGEVIAINLTSGHYYSFRGSADVIWAMALAGWTPEEVVDRLAREGSSTSSDLMQSVTAFFEYLLGEKLLVISKRQARDELPDLKCAGSFEPPKFEKFTDMQELLLVDPIHEVSEAGWPERKT